MNSTKNKAIKNLLYGFLSRITALIFGLLVPRLILTTYGSEANGITASITQIFAYVALLEAGVGGATLQALYSPIGKDDKQDVSAILAATHRYYKRTGYIYTFAVVVLSIVYPLLVKSELGFFTIFGIVLFNGLGGAINFLFQGKYHLLLQADGKEYIKTNLTTIVYMLSNIFKIVLAISGCNIVLLQAVYFGLNVLQMLYITIYIRKHYSWLNLKETPNYDAISQKNSVMLHQISGLIFGNTDSIILTFAKGLKLVSVYSIISSLITHISGLLNTFGGSILFNLGQNFHNNREKFNKIYTTFESILYCLSAICVLMIYIFLNPFLSLYTSGVTDINYVDKYLPFLFSLCYWLTWIRMPSVYVVNNCAGHFKLTQKQTIIESVINIVVSIVLVNFIGIYGVLIGTIVALLYRTNEMIIYSAKKILNRGVLASYKNVIVNSICIIILGMLGQKLLPVISNYLDLVIWGILYILVISIIIFSVNIVFNRDLLNNIKALVARGL